MNCNLRCLAKDLTLLLSPSISSMKDGISSMKDVGVGAALLSGGC